MELSRVVEPWCSAVVRVAFACAMLPGCGEPEFKNCHDPLNDPCPSDFLLIDDFEAPVDDRCDDVNECHDDRDCRKVGRGLLSGECSNVFCSDPAEAAICPRLLDSSPQSRVLRLDASADVDEEKRTFGGYTIQLRTASDVFSLPERLTCLSFWIRVESLPDGMDLEVSLKDNTRNETNGKFQPFQAQTGSPSWCKTVIEVDPELIRTPTGVEPVKLDRLVELNFLLTCFPGAANESALSLGASIELDDVAFEACASARSGPGVCPVP